MLKHKTELMRWTRPRRFQPTTAAGQPNAWPNSSWRSIDGARAVERPFFHLEFDRVFPDDTYAQILTLMPESDDYRPMHGRSKGHDLKDGTHTRVKIDLFPEYIRNLPPEKRALWDVVGVHCAPSR
jgi:hypothetical protein